MIVAGSVILKVDKSRAWSLGRNISSNRFAGAVAENVGCISAKNVVGQQQGADWTSSTAARVDHNGVA